MKPWEEFLTDIKPLGKGGQGSTSTCIDIRTGLPAVLKVLISQKDKERRRRMFREVSNLRSLDHPQIPKVLYSNVQEFEDDSTKLYFASDLVDGSDLYSFNKGQLSIKEKIGLSISIAEVVKYCHAENVTHRDIKPDNIIISREAPYQPFLIDFGISFNTEVHKDECLTPEAQHLGNRFLFLPELRGSESNKRDKRSDVTYVAGILFFLLCGESPTSLIDESGHMPHQRKLPKSILDLLPPYQRALINNYFDISFNSNINDRWQTIESIIDQLNHIMKTEDSEQENQSPEKMIDEIQKHTKLKPKYDALQKIKAILDSFTKTLSDAHTKAMLSLGENFIQLAGNYGVDYPKMTLQYQLGVRNQFAPELEVWPLFKAYFTGSEFVVVAILDGKTRELFRVNSQDPISWDVLEDIIFNFYLQEMLFKSKS